MIKPLKSAAKRILSQAGVYVSRAAPYDLDTQLQRVIKQLGINCVFDVGAYHGEFGRRLRDLGYRGKLVSFEPVAAHFKELAAEAGGDSLWDLRPYALSDRDGEPEINLYDGATFASLLLPNDYGKTAFAGKMKVIGREKIQTRRLEGVFEDCIRGIAQPSVFLKTDCQGFDLQAIRGAGSKLAQIAALQCEVAVNPIYAAMSNSLADIIPVLFEEGFRLTGAFPVSTDRNDGLSLVELDCVFIRPGTQRPLPAIE